MSEVVGVGEEQNVSQTPLHPNGGGGGTTSSPSTPFLLGDAASAIFLLRDYSKFGLAERVCYHFDLTEALMASDDATVASTAQESDEANRRASTESDETGNENDRHVRGSGVLRLIEFAPTALWQRLTRRQKKSLRNKLRMFNQTTEKVHAERNTICYQPQKLPLQCNPSTRFYFGYEVTRIVFCVDASASLTSTFGVMGRPGSGRKDPLCPLDRLPQMVRTFFQALIEPIVTATMVEPWKPRLSVTVLAVYPMGETSETSLLVRDYQVYDSASAKRLISEIEKWTYSEVESGISDRLARRNAANAWSIPIYSSNMKHILAAGDYALDILSSEGRPVIVVATDGRAISCDGIVDVFLDVDRLDIPVHILDLSMSESHVVEDSMGAEVVTIQPSKTEMNFLSYDPGGTMDFPAHLTDDSEALFIVTRATGGCFLDSHLLVEAAKSTAGQQFLADDPVQQSHSFKRRFARMNGLQWLVLFSLSPITPTFHSSWGKLVPPLYLQKQLSKSAIEAAAPAMASNLPSDIVDVSRHQSLGNDQLTRKHQATARTTFSIYVVSPVRVKALILMRIKEGYRAKQYGLSTNDPDKVFIQFTLPMEFGTILHYELSYKALSSEDHMVGSAHIKIELSGDASFVQLVKHDFLRHSMQVPDKKLFTIRHKKSARLCQVIRSTRSDDILQSYLKPPQIWSDQLVGPDSPFAKRLGTLTRVQRKMHFEADYFDVVCTGLVPYGLDDQFLSQFVSSEDGTQELVDAVASWSTLTVKAGSMFVKRISSAGRSTNYCVVELAKSETATNLYSVGIEFFGGTDPEDRLKVLFSLKDEVAGLKNVEVLHKQMAPFLAGQTHQQSVKKRNVEIQFHHASWDLVTDPELLSLLTKRRIEIGQFRLLESKDDYALFAKLVPTGTVDTSPDDLVQYQIAVVDEKVLVDLHMESESGVFNPYLDTTNESGRFGRMVNTIRRRDQECGRALRSRTNLLRIFQSTASDDDTYEEDHRSSVTRILAYSSRVTRKLRFFTTTGEANNILMNLTSDLVLSSSFDVECAKLRISVDEILREEEPGKWFVQQYDRQTMSIVHLSLVDRSTEEDGVAHTFRAMTFFTNGISDLYSKRDDMADDDSTESHISEYLCVSEYADQFELYHKKNFALASYLALRQARFPEEADITRTDFGYAVETLDFVEVGSILVGGMTSQDNNNHSKLLQSIESILQPVPGDSEHFYYIGDVLGEKISELGDDDSVASSDGSSRDSSDNIDSREQNTSVLLEDEENKAMADDEDSYYRDDTVPSPIFVKFQLDGVAVSVEDLGQISRSGVLKTTVSVFKSTVGSLHPNQNLTWLHRAFASEITALLKSYVAEQTLARLQGARDLQSQEHIQLIMKCLSRIQSVVTFFVEIYFFISQRGIMMPAGAPAGAEAAVEEGFSILDSEVSNRSELVLTRLPGNMYFVSSIHEDAGENSMFWCVLNLQDAVGNISAQIYHPEGPDMALSVMHKLHEILCSCIHATNQRLLLRSMHRTRMASALLIPRQTQSSENVSLPADQSGERINFSPGIFSCPVVFHTVFDLYQRAATNPGQVARTLEATVLHNFAVSNRPGIFVYKDESDAIFYMEIKPRGSGIDSDGQVELLVYGLGDPGPSVTNQLRILLQRRLLLIAVDMLSSVLTKNPHFKWKRADFLFLRSFEREWTALEDSDAQASSQYRYYKFPGVITDPCMVLLFLRQNLCGSTFFHRLNDIDQAGHNPSPPITTAGMEDECLDGVILKMNQHEFSLYYNYAPSKLEPSFQGLSTLTEKGAEYCRQAGTGIAMIEFTLVKGSGDYVDQTTFARLNSESYGGQLPVDLRMQALSSFPIQGDDGSVCARVKITDTALNREALHDWICLTLNQAMVAWVTERWLDRSFFWSGANPREHVSPNAIPDEGIRRDLSIDRLCPGLPAFKSILETSYSLPHPAIKRFESTGVTKSSSVASLTLNLLQQHVLSPLLEKKIFNVSNDKSRKRSLLDHLSRRVKIIRLSRCEKPVAVQIQRTEGRKVAVTAHLGDGLTRPIDDSPVDCPEYLCFFSLSEQDDDVDSIDGQLRLYREVVVHDGLSEKSASIELLESIKKSRPKAFLRSFGFIFSVKRNSRRLWTYNWNPDIARSVSLSLREADVNAVAVWGNISSRLQRRSLGLQTPGISEGVHGKQKKPAPSHKEPVTRSKVPPLPEAEPIEKGHGYANVPARRIRRPTTIRRPKLIGKSVEGAAMQAVAASRKRASSNQFKNLPSQGMKPGGRGVASRDPSGALRGRPNAPSRSASDQQKNRSATNLRDAEDNKAARVKKDFLSLCGSKKLELHRLASVQQSARLHLMNVWWPTSPSHNVASSILEMLMAVAPKGWQDVCSLPPLPGQVTSIFIPTLARWIVALTPGLEFVRTLELRDTRGSTNSVFLCSAVRNVRGTKCCAVVRLSMVQAPGARRGAPIVLAQGWMLNLPRRSITSQRKKADGNCKSARLMHRDSAGMDKLMMEMHMSFGLERLLFDFSASMVERAVRMLDNRIKFEDLVPTVRELMRRYPYERQKRIPRLNYRAFEGTIVLKSYGDRFIDMFDSKALFRRLRLEADKRDLLDCKDALCFKKPISVKGCHSICFLTLHPNDDSKMQLVILCRTQGVNIADFMFREGSNVAIHILDNIAVEGAGLALRELHYVAKCLLRDGLWNDLVATTVPQKKALSLQASPRAKPFVKEKYYEMLSLSHVQSLLELPFNSNAAGKTAGTIPADVYFLFSEESGLDWRSICSCMKKSKMFSSSSTFTEEGGTTINLFHHRTCGVFLKLEIGAQGRLRRADVIEKDHDTTKSQIVFETVVNYILHYVWYTL